MPSIRKVQATNPHTGDVTVRTSKSKVYTHALVVKQNAQETFAIPAGTYGDAVAKATPMIGDFEVVEVEVLDEGFNA